MLLAAGESSRSEEEEEATSVDLKLVAGKQPNLETANLASGWGGGGLRFVQCSSVNKTFGSICCVTLNPTAELCKTEFSIG